MVIFASDEQNIFYPFLHVLYCSTFHICINQGKKDSKTLVVFYISNAPSSMVVIGNSENR